MVCAAGPRCSPRYRVLSRPGSDDYRGSLRPRSRNEHRTPATSNVPSDPLTILPTSFLDAGHSVAEQGRRLLDLRLALSDSGALLDRGLYSRALRLLLR
jgi:hypothetical protein